MKPKTSAAVDGGGQVVPIRRSMNAEPRTSELSDEALLLACGIGETAALGALFDRHHDAVHRLVSRLLYTEPSEIDDLVQTTFLAAWRAARGYTGRGSVKSFLFGIAVNTVRRHIRGARRQRAALLDWPPPAGAPAPDHAALRSQQVARLAAALEHLPDKLRVVYVLCDLEDVPGVEAARVLALRPGTLWRRLHEARRALRVAIDGGTR